MIENGHKPHPGYLIEATEVDVIPIPGTDATVTMKRRATYDDELAVHAAMPAGLERHMWARVYVPARTMVMIESWTLTEKDGSPLPISEEVLTRRLSRRVAGFIADEAEKRYNGRDEGSEAPLGSPSALPSAMSPSTRRKR